MIGVFVRAVIFGLGVELGREIYKTVKTKAMKAGGEDEPRPEKKTGKDLDPTVQKGGDVEEPAEKSATTAPPSPECEKKETDEEEESSAPIIEEIPDDDDDEDEDSE